MNGKEMSKSSTTARQMVSGMEFRAWGVHFVHMFAYIGRLNWVLALALGMSMCSDETGAKRKKVEGVTKVEEVAEQIFIPSPLRTSTSGYSYAFFSYCAHGPNCS